MLGVKQEPPSFLKVTAVKTTILQIDVMKLDLESLLTANSCNTLFMAEDISVVTETLFSRDSQFVFYDQNGRALSVDVYLDIVRSGRIPIQSRITEGAAVITDIPVGYKTLKLGLNINQER